MDKPEELDLTPEQQQELLAHYKFELAPDPDHPDFLVATMRYYVPDRSNALVDTHASVAKAVASGAGEDITDDGHTITVVGERGSHQMYAFCREFAANTERRVAKPCELDHRPARVYALDEALELFDIAEAEPQSPVEPTKH